MDSNLAQALVVGGVWFVVIVVVRLLLRRGFDRYERRLAERDPAVAARRRTTFSFLLRVVIALITLIGVWNVLTIFPVTEEVARAFLASSAVLALIAGLALTTPLGNLGSGVLLAFTQPVRLGDRITLGEHTGVVSAISLVHTQLVTDEDRYVFIPNTLMVSNVLVNRSVGDPRRIVTVRVPVSVAAPFADARRVSYEAASSVPGAESVTVDLSEVGEKTGWLEVVAYAPAGSKVPTIAGEIRERVLAALAKDDLLPA